jgi:hypothetical protein
VKHADIHTDVYGSDHCPVSLELTLELEDGQDEEENLGKLF